jgi:1-acyl-sn-glycerol-3-phosphate acyltransferase
MFWIFVAFLVYLFVLLFYGKKKDREFLNFLYRRIGKAIVHSMFLKVTPVYHWAFEANRTYVIVSNHQTVMDIPANVASSPQVILFKFLGKKEAAKVPFFGFLIERLCILVDRKSEASRKDSFFRMRDELLNGYSIIIYPEGTRNRSEAPVKDYYDGAFRLAIETQSDLVVTTLVGIRAINPPNGVLTYFPGEVTAHWDAPISTLGMTLEDLPRLKEMAKEIMVRRLQA